MNSFSIRDIENLSGIKAHTLRVWEQRYGIIRPLRKGSNHRQYGISELKHILRISHLYNQGYKISRIAEMSEEQIKKLALEEQTPGDYDVFINQMLEASMDFDENLFRRALDTVIYHQGLQHAIIEVVYPFLNKIGMLWLTGNVIPSQEHFASNIIRNKIMSATSSLPGKKEKQDIRFVLFCPPEEFHEIPLLLAQYCLKKRGISSVLFGVNTEKEHLKEFLDKNPSSHLFIHLITNFSDLKPPELLAELCDEFPHIQVHAAGAVFQHVKSDKENLRVFSHLQSFLAYLDR